MPITMLYAPPSVTSPSLEELDYVSGGEQTFDYEQTFAPPGNLIGRASYTTNYLAVATFVPQTRTSYIPSIETLYVLDVDYRRDLNFGVILAETQQQITIYNNLLTPLTIAKISYLSAHGVVIYNLAVDDVIPSRGTITFQVSLKKIALISSVSSFITIEYTSGLTTTIDYTGERVSGVVYSYPPDLSTYDESYRLSTTVLEFTNGGESRAKLMSTYKIATKYDVTLTTMKEVQFYTNILKYGLSIPIHQPLWGVSDELGVLDSASSLEIDTVGKGYVIGDYAFIYYDKFNPILMRITAVSATEIGLASPISLPAGALVMPTFLGMPAKNTKMPLTFGNYGKVSLAVTEM